MSPERLREIWREIGLVMGHKHRGYSRRIFVDDLNSLHPGLVTVHRDGRDSQLKQVLQGADVPAYWDKVVADLYERCITARTHPPTPGPTWTGFAVTSQERERAGRKLREWRISGGMTLDQVAEATGFSRQQLVCWENRKSLLHPKHLVILGEKLGLDLFVLTSSAAFQSQKHAPWTQVDTGPNA